MSKGSWSEGDLHALFQVAHHDIWWAKGHLWTTTSWALALLTAVVGVGRLFYSANETVLSNTWLLVLSAAVLAFAVAWYLARLHSDIVRARNVIAFIRQDREEFDALFSALPIPREAAPDSLRGVSFVVALLIAVSVAFGIAIYVLTLDDFLALVAAVVHSVTGFLLLIRAIRSAKAAA